MLMLKGACRNKMGDSANKTSVQCMSRKRCTFKENTFFILKLISHEASILLLT